MSQIVEPLLEVKNHMAYPSEYARAIKPFKDIVRRDRGSKNDSQGRKKYQASRELAFIYFMEDPRSPYFSLAEDSRKEKSIEVIFGEDSDWKPDDLVEEAREVYRDSIETNPVRLLRSAHKAINDIREYLENIDFDERTKSDSLVHKPKDVMKTISDLGNVVEGLEQLEKQVKSQLQKDDSENRGGVNTNKYNE